MKSFFSPLSTASTASEGMEGVGKQLFNDASSINKALPLAQKRQQLF